MRHFASPQFWKCYQRLPSKVHDLADKNYQLLKSDPKHPSLHFKQIGKLCSVRVGAHFRALGLDKSEGIVWFWIGTHADYDKLLP